MKNNWGELWPSSASKAEITIKSGFVEVWMGSSAVFHPHVYESCTSASATCTASVVSCSHGSGHRLPSSQACSSESRQKPAPWAVYAKLHKIKCCLMLLHHLNHSFASPVWWLDFSPAYAYAILRNQEGLRKIIFSFLPMFTVGVAGTYLLFMEMRERFS